MGWRVNYKRSDFVKILQKTTAFIKDYGMKFTLVVGLIALMVISVCGMATFLMYHNISGWGWLIFIAFVCTQYSVKSKDEKEKD